VINVTWRGKTYVGTLLDSTRHVNQWAPPRYVSDKFDIYNLPLCNGTNGFMKSVSHLFTLFEKNSQSAYLIVDQELNYLRK
jgi:hypothetical protein